MPGYDRSGPWGAGPGTGRGLGVCGPETATAAEAPTRDDGAARRGFGPWGRGRGFGARGRGRGRGFGAGRGALRGFAALVAAPREQESLLLRRMEALLAALDRVKELLSKGSAAEGADRE